MKSAGFWLSKYWDVFLGLEVVVRNAQRDAFQAGAEAMRQKLADSYNGEERLYPKEILSWPLPPLPGAAMSEGRRVTKVILWTNGMVMSFDQNGEQWGEYQGLGEVVLKRVFKDFPDAEFMGLHDWNTEVRPYLPIKP